MCAGAARSGKRGSRKDLHDRLSAKRTLEVVRLRDDDADQTPVLIVEDVAERASSTEL
jgi:hypothetical protein